MIPISPSNYQKFLDCPYQYSGVYVTKEIKFQENEAMRRGSRLHKCLELTLKGSELSAGWRDEDQEILNFCQPVLNIVRRAMANDWSVFIEHEAAVNRRGQSAGWWQTDYLRSKIDVVAADMKNKTAMLVDWKSGKTPGKEAQFVFNAFSLFPELGITDYTGYFIYFDLKKVEKHSISLPFTDLANAGENFWSKTSLKDLVANVRRLEAAWVTHDWPKTPHRGCRWCDMNCEHKR
jgi:hypothetical protein